MEAIYFRYVGDPILTPGAVNRSGATKRHERAQGLVKHHVCCQRRLGR